MRKAVLNFLKGDIRMPHLMFWDWCFLVILISALGFFISEASVSAFLLPRLISLFLMQSIIFSIPYRLAQFHELGIMRLIGKKGSIYKLVISFFISRLFILVLQTLLVIIVGKEMMEVTLHINGAFFIISFLLTVFIFMMISSIIGLKFKTQNSALGLSQAIYFILIAISGIVYPIENSSHILRKISIVSPIKYLSKFWESAFYGKQKFQLEDVVILFVMSLILSSVVFLAVKSERKRNNV